MIGSKYAVLTNVSLTPALFPPNRRTHTHSERNLGTQRHPSKAPPLRTAPRSSINNRTPRTCKSLPECLPDDIDLMIEAKDKGQAVFELYRIYGLADVI